MSRNVTKKIIISEIRQHLSIKAPNKGAKGGHNLHNHAEIFMNKIKLTEFQNSLYLLSDLPLSNDLWGYIPLSIGLG